MSRIPPKVLAALAALLAAVPAARRLLRRRSSSATSHEPAPPSAPAAAGPAPATHATPPPEVPGPSVTPPQAPMSETEREERADALKPEHLPGDLDDGRDVDETRVDDEAAAAAAEAAMIGGPAPRDVSDPAMAPVYEAGGGEQEGFEAAEADLIENATHGDGRGDPIRDAFPAEVESGNSTARYGEEDSIESTEVVEDVGARESTGAGDAADEPGAGPNVAKER